MAHAQLAVDISHDWDSDVFVSPDSKTVCWILAMLPVDDALEVIAEIQSYDIDEAVETLCHHESVVDSELLYQTPTRVLVKLEMGRPRFYEPVQECGVPIVPPITVSDGTATFEARGTGSELTELVESLESVGCSPAIEWVREDTDSHQLLSIRQRDVVTTAIELGYYESPRECTLTELSEQLGIAKSTCSDILHRAEGKIIRWYAQSFECLTSTEAPSRDSIPDRSPAADGTPQPAGLNQEPAVSQNPQDLDAGEMLTLFANENVRSLFCHANTPKTVQELANECDLSTSTSYRLTNKLEQADLFASVTESEEANSSRYHRTIQRALISIGDTVSVNCEPFVETDHQPEPAARTPEE